MAESTGLHRYDPVQNCWTVDGNRVSLFAKAKEETSVVIEEVETKIEPVIEKIEIEVIDILGLLTKLWKFLNRPIVWRKK